MRAIIDDYVQQRCSELGIDTVYYDNVYTYKGNVKENLEKVKLESTKFGLEKESIVKSLRDKYESIQIAEDNCIIQFGAVSVPVTRNQLRLLKALAIEQVNRNQEYSDIIAYIFVELCKAFLKNSDGYDFEPYENATKLQEVVQEQVREFIKKKI